jgi:uncharacterized protein (DUF1501 family)
MLEQIDRMEASRREMYRKDILAGIKGGIDRYLSQYSSDVTGAPLTSLMQYGWHGYKTLQTELALLYHCFEQNLSSVAVVNIGSSTWDCHSGYSPTDYGGYRLVTHAIANFIQALKDGKLLQDTTVVIFSEMSRDLYGGANHLHYSTWGIFGGRIGTKTGLPRVYGGTAMPSFDAMKLDPHTGAESKGGMLITPKELLALLLEDAGVPPGREIETLLRINQAPPFLRKLIA